MMTIAAVVDVVVVIVTAVLLQVKTFIKMKRFVCPYDVECR